MTHNIVKLIVDTDDASNKRRLEKAIAAVAGQHEVQVHWHPFQLNPTMPKEGISRKDYCRRYAF